MTIIGYMMKKTQSRILGFDALRLVAIIAVIAIHVSYKALYSLNSSPFDWWTVNIMYSLVRWAVPVFFMMSGALQLSKEITIHDIYIKRLPKILLPFLTWSLIYIILDITHNKSHTFLQQILRLFTTPVIYHLWFVYALIGVYIILPLVSIIVKHSSRVLLEYFLILSVIVNCVLPLLFRFSGIRIGIEMPFVSGYLLYFVLGYYLYTQNISKRLKHIINIFTPISVLVICFGTYYLSAKTGKYNDYFHQYLLLPMVFISSQVFILSKNIEPTIIKTVSSKTNISRICYGIYLSHLFILGILDGGKLGFKLNLYTFSSPVSIVVTTTVTFMISFIIFFTLEHYQTVKFVKSFSKFVY